MYIYICIYICIYIYIYIYILVKEKTFLKKFRPKYFFYNTLLHLQVFMIQNFLKIKQYSW